MEKGVTLGWVVDDSGTHSLINPEVRKWLRTDLNADVVRFEFRLGSHALWDNGLVGTYKQAVKDLQEDGLQVIGEVGNQLVKGFTQADWSAPDGLHAQQPFRTAFSHAAASLVAAFPEIERWEIWNEPNSGATKIEPERFAQLLHDTKIAIDQTHPAATLRIITGGLFAHNNGGNQRDRSAAPYLDTVLKTLSKLSKAWPFTDIGQHYYLDPGGHPAAEKLVGDLKTYLGFLQEVFTKYTLSDDTKVIITEAGWATSLVTEQQQGDNLEALFTFGNANALIETLCWFTLQDNVGSNPPIFDGLYTPQGRAKQPAVDNFRGA